MGLKGCDTSVVVVDGMPYDTNSFIIYPSRKIRKSYFQAEELPKDYDLGEAPKTPRRDYGKAVNTKELLQASSYP